VCLEANCLVVRESQFDELFGLRHIAVSWAICITCWKTSSEFYMHNVFTHFIWFVSSLRDGFVTERLCSRRERNWSYTILYNVSDRQSSKVGNLSSVNSQHPLFMCHCTTKLEGRGIDFRWCHWNYPLHNPSGRTKALGSSQPLTEMSTRNISWEVKAAVA
jgi:hypothetical protein